MIHPLLSRREWANCSPNKNSSVKNIDGLVKLNAFIYGAGIAVNCDVAYRKNKEAVERPAKTIQLRQGL